MDGPLVIFTPSFVTAVNGLPSLSWTVIPSPLTTVLPFAPLVPLLKVMESRPLRFFAKRTLRILFLLITPILFSVNSSSLVTPPLMSNCSLSFFLMVVPESPPYFIPSSLVATSWVVPFSSWYLMRVISFPLTSAAPLSAIISALRPSLPVKPMWPIPSLPDMDTTSLPFLSVTATLPSVPFAASGPVRDTPALSSFPTFTDSALRFLFIFTSIVVLPVAASCLMKVLILSPL